MGQSTSNTIDKGAAAERLAARLLEDRGYSIVERNFRFKGSGELDIVARQGDCLVFVEVRSRADDEHGDALDTVSRHKQLQVARIAQHYLRERQPEFEDIRFDVVSITNGVAELFVDAWRLGLLR